MKWAFLQNCQATGLRVVAGLYRFSAFFTASRSLKFQQLRLKKVLDIIVVVEGLVV